MYYRELDRRDVMGYHVLSEAVFKSMAHRDFWFPIKADEKQFFTGVWTFFHGCFTRDGKMIAACGLFLNPAECAHDAYEIGLDPDTTAQISRCMVLAPFRGRGISQKMIDALALRASYSNKKDMILCCHTDDYGMNSSAQKLGMKPELTDGAKKRIYYRMKL